MWAAALFALIAAVTAAAGAKNISVDDTDASIVYYSPGQAWTRHIEQEKSYELYNNSDSFTSVLGATATLAFNGAPELGICRPSADHPSRDVHRVLVQHWCASLSRHRAQLSQ